jgi:transcriptional regulator of nitric oxide reductase
MWIPPEIKDPVLQHHPTRKSIGYFGAVRLRDGKFLFAREQNRFDAMTTWDFLRLLHGRSLKSRRRVVVITDNAKYHHANLHRAWRQEHEPQFHLDYLPP